VVRQMLIGAAGRPSARHLNAPLQISGLGRRITCELRYNIAMSALSAGALQPQRPLLAGSVSLARCPVADFGVAGQGDRP
jgi:hypothetical protein